MAQYEEKVTKFNELMKDHNDWMRNSINLIASENVTSSAVKTAMVSDLSHRYAEGQAYERFYQGCTYIDEIEDISKKLSCELYDCTYANVQPVSGVTANLAAFFSFSNMGDKMMAMNIPYGGHISHAKVSAAGICGLTTYDHPFDPSVMNIDIDAMNKKIRELEPKIVLFGGSLFLFPHPIKEAVDAANEVGATILYDAAHVLGLIAGKQTIKNAQALAAALAEEGFNVMCEDLGYTKSHQVAMNTVDVKRPAILAKELELNNVILNKNLIPGDMQDDSDDPSGIRIGVQEITRRGMKEDEMKDVAHFIKRVAFDGDNIKEEVTEYMNEYTKIHYAFKVDEGYEYIQY